jgi:hypothetical protein
MNRAYSLKAVWPSSPGMKSWRFPSRWPTKNRQRKRPVKAMAYFFAMEDFKIPEELIA